MKPGLIRDTLTFFLFISKCKLSAKLVRADFEAQYAPAAGNPRYPATEEIIDIWPLFLFAGEGGTELMGDDHGVLIHPKKQPSCRRRR